MKELGGLSLTPTRNDLRYINDHDDPKAVLAAWYNEIPMGAFTSNDAEAFRAAVEDELRHIDDNACDPVDMSLISIEEV